MSCPQDLGTSVDDLIEALRLALGYSIRHRRFALKAYIVARPVIAARTRMALRTTWTGQRHTEFAIRAQLLKLTDAARPLMPEGLMISPDTLDYALFSADDLVRIVLAAAEEADEAARAAQSLVSGHAQDGVSQILGHHRRILAAQRALLDRMLTTGAHSDAPH